MDGATYIWGGSSKLNQSKLETSSWRYLEVCLLSDSDAARLAVCVNQPDLSPFSAEVELNQEDLRCQGVLGSVCWVVQSLVTHGQAQILGFQALLQLRFLSLASRTQSCPQEWVLPVAVGTW